ncbi:MAG: thioesterase family protein [Thermoleophilaceae bacterium]|nr:thioesterase family protein [Thermoleophilaceae bacterium]
MPFDEDTGLTPAGDGRWEGAVAEGWSTPRGPLGGYVMAIVMRGLELAVADPERQARSVTMHFLRPPHPGPVTVSATVERTGRSLTTVTGRLEQDGKLLGLAIGAYSKPYESPLLDELPMPMVGAPDGSVISGPGGTRIPPEFTERMVMEPRFGDPFFTRSEHGETGGWLGLREARPIDALAVAVLADAWFPAPWPRLSGLAPAPTIDLTVHFRSPLPARGPLLLGRFNSRHVRDGFFEEDGVLWSPDGALVAQSRQLGLLIGAQV